jgi:acetyltransferase-like isoleucine patch superfamily enzyme
MSRLTTWLRKKFAPKQAGIPAYVSIGRGTYLMGDGHFEYTSQRAPVSIGSFCSIAREVRFMTDAGHHMDMATTFPLGQMYFGRDPHPAPTKGGIVIGHDVWIGHRALIMGGVTIGNGAVIGAGSVVTRDVPAYCVYAGNPARFIKRRLGEEAAESMERIAWWGWSDEKLRACLDDFRLPAGEFVRRHSPFVKDVRKAGIESVGAIDGRQPHPIKRGAQRL